MAQKLYPASNPMDDRLFDELFYRQFLMDHPNPVVRVTTPDVADAPFTVKHGLGRLPNGYLLIHSDAPVQLYGDPNEWDDKEMVLYATATEVECTIIVL